jgi:hypothetical protein
MQLHKVLAIVAIAAALTAAHSQDMKEQARTAGIADAATTVLGLAAGAAEANPLGAVIAIGVKPLVLRYIEGLPQEQRPQVYALAASVWGGVAANNVCVIASIVSGGAFAPVCLVLGAAWGVKKWKDTEPERIFWAEGCPTLRIYANEPDMVCVFVPQPPAGRTVLVQGPGEVQAP